MGYPALRRYLIFQNPAGPADSIGTLYRMKNLTDVILNVYKDLYFITTVLRYINT